MLELLALVRWKTVDEGGYATSYFSGVRPSFSVAGDLITSEIFRLDGVDLMQGGQEYEVLIRLPYGEVYRDQIKEAMLFTLNGGSRVLATGVVQEVD